MTELADVETRRLISESGLDRTLFVEAGAGSGKTTQLVGRIVNLVVIQGMRLANVAAITFTEAAAAELQSRIRVEFEKKAASAIADGDAALAARCEEAIADADMAAISTLHGFASRILGEFAVDAGLPPRVRVLDEVSSTLASEERWSRFVDSLHDDEACIELLTRASLLQVLLEPEYRGQVTLRDVAIEFNQNWDRLGPLTHEKPGALSPLDFSGFDSAVERVINLPDRCSDPTDKLLALLVGDLIPAMSAVREIQDPNRKLGRIVAVGKWGKGRVGRAAAWDGGADSARELITEVNEEMNVLRRRLSDEVLTHLLHLVASEVVDAAEARKNEGGLEFHDLLVLARNMLRRSDEARRRLHDRYTHILLDEFQDTDPIQIELAMLIAASLLQDDDGGAEPGLWSDLTVEDGRIFFVGDPKQSIYRFRRADINLFLTARERFGPDGTWAKLTTNFRTVSPILDWVNAIFGQLMPVEIQGEQPLYEPLLPYRQVQGGADHRPVLLGGKHPDPKVKAAVLREAEAADVARVIDDIRQRPDAWPVHDEGTGQWRPARLADVTILIPTRTSLPFLRSALDRNEIVYRIATGTLVYDTQEVRDALAAMHAINDPTDELSLVATLRSPLFACSDVDLFNFREAGGRWDLRGSGNVALPEDHPVVSALAYLKGLWEVRWWATPSELLDRLLRDRRASMLAFGTNRPADVWRRLRFLVDQARAFEEAGGGDLRAFVEWAELQGADLARVHEPLLPETDQEALQILTVHGSKGLEFPITILSGMTTRPGGRRQGVSVLWADSGPPEVKLSGGVQTVNHEPRANLEGAMDEHEKLRLAYVAATRARDHLIVSCHHKDEKKLETYAGRFFTNSTGHDELWRKLPDRDPQQLTLGGPVSTAESQPLATDSESREDWIARREALISRNQVPRVVSATGVARSAQPSEILQDDDDDRFDQPLDGAVVQRRRGRSGTAIGSAVHGVLQFVDLENPVEIDGLVAQQCDIESIPHLTQVVSSLVNSILASEAVALASNNPHHKELFVAVPVGERVIEGYVDLLIEAPEGLVVVDYKTDTARNEAEIDSKMATYELQAASYAVALEEATGLPVIDCRFVFGHKSGCIERSVLNLDDAKRRVRQTVDS